ncbi:hypothetical protein WJX72_003763 [[Myrmecia] bisecta]|uniref:ABC transporter domain-containing protein n=1 Tax=[Myrmecia] bisecta TaxID=41462 RepID=A0AAW1R6H9_9CHLO
MSSQVGRVAEGETNETTKRQADDFDELREAALQRLDKQNSFSAILPGKDGKDLQEVDLRTLGRSKRRLIVTKALNTEDQDQEAFLRKISERMARVGIKHRTVEVRFQNLSIEAGVYIGSRALPTVTNSYLNFVDGILQKLRLAKDNRRKFVILDDISGVIPPGRMTLLLGPPGAGKSTLLKALAGKLQHDADLKVTGDITYNGHHFGEFVPQRTAAYVDQDDTHLAELTVRETFDFAARCQGVGHKAEELRELRKREKEQGIKPDWEIDAFMKADAIQGKRENIVTEYIMRILGLDGLGFNIVTEYIMRILGLDICADTFVGNAMFRGISGGQKKRVTTGEMIVGPKKTLFMDEISTGLDSSTTFQITKCLRDFTHLREATVLIALLQPAPETYDLFDDILLMSEGHIVYHGPREEVVEFFASCGFQCPERKGVPDFLQEVTSRKDQKQYWSKQEKYKFVPVREFADAFHKFKTGARDAQILATPFDKSAEGARDALVTSRFALGAGPALRACLRRELTLVQRNAFVYVFKAVQAGFIAFIVAVTFLRTNFHPDNVPDANIISGMLFFSLLQMFFNGIAEMTFTIERLAVYHKQSSNLFFPAWTFCLPTTIVRIPVSLLETGVWSIITYWAVGLAPYADRFFMYWLLLFLIHNMAITLFRAIGSLARNLVVANALGSLSLLIIMLLGGFVLTPPQIHPWWIWGFWINPLSYLQRAILINEFTAPRWNIPSSDPKYTNLGNQMLGIRGFQNEYWWCWLAVGTSLFAMFLFNVVVILAHKYLGPYETNTAVLSEDALLEREVAKRGSLEVQKGAVAVDMKGLEKEADAPHVSSRRMKLVEAGQRLSMDASGSHSRKNLGGSQRRISLQHNGENGAQPPIPEAKGLATEPNGHGANEPADLEAGNPARSLRNMGSKVDRGMVLPFNPLTMTFSNVHYFVDLPSEMANKDLPTIKTINGKKQLELLQGISGAFRPGVLTSLMGVSGAGKTTLMDVLAGRKTGGHIEGDIRINGHVKEQRTFARISGYVEQTDIHSPQATVGEAVLFSARLRMGREVENDTVIAFTDEVMDLVELTSLKGVLVGTPGVSGLSVEQRKRLTIAVELVANPSIVFMDEPTSGLDARAAAIVMRTVRNIVNTGRSIVCTIHQPSIDIFEAFDELLLLKRGGQTIYAGPLGHLSADLVAFFSAVPGVPAIRTGLNPATWMLEVTTPGMEERLGVDFAKVYEESALFKRTEALIARESVPPEGSEPLFFETQYARTPRDQFLILFRKFWTTYWRLPEYNGVRFYFSLAVALLFGTIYWKLCGKTNNETAIYQTMGGLYVSTLFLGILNSIFVQPVVSDERSVSYREKAAGMYSVFPWYLAMAAVETVYLVAQAVLYVCVVYFMCGFQVAAGPFFWFMLIMLLTLVYFTFYGVIAVAITPNLMVAAVLSGSFYGLFNLFAGFVIPLPKIPGWVVWIYYINPVSWTLYGLIETQLGKMDDRRVELNTGTKPTVPEFLTSNFDYHHDFIGYTILILFGFCFVFWMLGAFAFKRLNFQNR